jgi:hypothetical protein
LNYTFLFLLVGIVLCSLPFQAAGQLIAGQPQNSTPATTQHKPVPLPHLYWHFLVYVNVLDTKAAELEAQGKDGSQLRNDLQTRTQLTDAEFTPVREASRRLSTEIKALNAQATAGNATGGTRPNPDTLRALATQREADINAEIAYLTQSLSPQKKASLDAFITQFFAPKQLSIKIPAPVQPAPAAVQQ